MFYAHRKAGKLSKCGSVYEYPGTVETAKGKQSVERVRVALRLRIVSKATKLDDVRFFLSSVIAILSLLLPETLHLFTREK